MDCVLNAIGIIVAIVVVIWSYVQWSLQYWQRKNIPSIQLQKTKEEISFADRFKDLYKEGKSKGLKYFGINIMSFPYLVIVDLEILKLIMTKDFKHFMDRKTYTNEKGEPLTCHLGSVDGDKWKHLRPKLTPTFTSGKLKNMFETFISSGKRLENYLTEVAERKETVDIKSAVERFGIDIIGSCAFGIECNAFTDPNSPFVIHAKKFMSMNKWKTTKDMLSRTFPTVFKWTGLHVNDKDVTVFFTNLAKDNIKYRKENNIQRNDLLHLLINAKAEDGSGKSRFTLQEMISQCFVFFTAGFETSSATITFTLFDMTQNPDIQDKLREEINAVLEKYDDKITYDSINEMKYMEQVINESMRIHNPVPINGRACSEEYRIPGTDIVIDKGTKVIIPTLAIHFDEEYYPNPEKFDPERFNEENTRNRHPYAFIPFGEGPRICIGARFGIMQTKVALTFILKNFKVSLNEKTTLPLKRAMTRLPTTRMQQTIWLDLEKV